MKNDISVNVLLVDDEKHILSALQRLFHDQDYHLITASSGEDGLEVLCNQDVAVIISDNCMPGMGGIAFLERAGAVSPDSMRIMMTAHADLQTAVGAINRGQIFRFIIKPWNNRELLDIVADGVQRFRMIRSLRHGDEGTLLSLAQTIELKDPYTKGHCWRVGDYARQMAEALGLDAATQEEIRHGGWLHDCGKIGVPEAILNHNGPLNEEQFSVVRNHPQWGAEVARQAHFSQRLVNIIQFHHERFDGGGYPLGLQGEAIPLEARIVTIADIFDALTSDRPYQAAHTFSEGLDILRKARGTAIDPRLCDLFTGLINDKG